MKQSRPTHWNNAQNRALPSLAHHELTQQVIGLAIEVHRTLGPGLLESAYEEALCYELIQAGLPFVRQRQLPLLYKNVLLDCHYQIDIIVADTLILEIKAVQELHPVHQAQLLTYLRLSNLRIGLILNFHAPTLKHGLRRMVLKA